MIADAAHIAKRGDCLRCVIEECVLECRIAPRPRDDLGAIARTDLGLIGFDDQIERSRIDIALLGQNCLERAHPQGHL